MKGGTLLKIIDLHTHTTASDGTYTPKELIKYAYEKGLSAIAITDHDTLSGIQEAVDYSKNFTEGEPLEVIPGIELSTNLTGIKADIHLLGLYINPNDSVFVERLDSILNSRLIRNNKMIERLQEIGFKISLEDVISNSSDGVITRAHFAKTLLSMNYVDTWEEAFDKYLGNGKIAYVPREKLSTDQAIKIILDNGGVPILAHPTLYNLDLRQLDQLISTLKEAGLKGIEGIYSTYTKAETRYIGEFAKKYNLVISGGSDFHGQHKSDIDLGTGRGQLQIPYDLLEPIRKLAKGPGY